MAANKKTATSSVRAKRAPRRATVSRATKEVTVDVTVALDGTGNATAKTGIPFFDHTVEHAGLAIGEALSIALGDKAGIARFGNAVVPLDEALMQVSLDLSARPY